MAAYLNHCLTPHSAVRVRHSPSFIYSFPHAMERQVRRTRKRKISESPKATSRKRAKRSTAKKDRLGEVVL